jgi:hypothetical protein
MNRHALLVGINRYRDDGINPLACATQDVLKLAVLLENYCAFNEVACLVDDQATKAGIHEGIRRLCGPLRSGDLFLFYFAGHGYEDRQTRQQTLLPFEVSLADLGEKLQPDLVFVRGVEEATARTGCRRFLVLDVCRTSLWADTRDVVAGPSPEVVQDIRNVVEQEAAGKPPLVAVCSCSPGQRAHELKQLGRSAFGRAFEELLIAHVRSGQELSLPGEAENDLAGRITTSLRQHRRDGRQEPQVFSNSCQVVLLEKTANPLPPPPPPPPPPDIEPPRRWWVGVLAAAGALALFAVLPAWLKLPKGSLDLGAGQGPSLQAPYTNGLGQVFLPGAGTNLLFARWETRVQDYQAFLTNAQLAWNRPAFPQDPDHPAVNVSWENAVAFADWLTREERKARRIAKGDRYRLPTDLEWSAAVGLPPERGDTPQARNLGIQDQYPWGGPWPPPPGAGNYGTSLGVDPHETASRVGVASNRLGVCDLGGNVREWCADWYDGHQRYRVLRGASWRNTNSDYLLSSYRGNEVPGHRADDVGFRLVLERGAD